MSRLLWVVETKLIVVAAVSGTILHDCTALLSVATPAPYLEAFRISNYPSHSVLYLSLSNQDDAESLRLLMFLAISLSCFCVRRSGLSKCQ